MYKRMSKKGTRDISVFVDESGSFDSDQVFHDILLQQIIRYLAQPSSDLNDYGCIKIYYDNGQLGMCRVLKDAFAMYSSKCEFVENVTPAKYKLG